MDREQYDQFKAAFLAAIERMEAVAEGIPIHKRNRGVSPATHVRHMAGHLEQHAKKARAVFETMPVFIADPEDR